MLRAVKDTLGIKGEFHDAMLTQYICEVCGFLAGGGVAAADIESGVVAIGVADLWLGESHSLSEYFRMRSTQLALKAPEPGQGGKSDG
jgi:hypothetical protein